MIGVINKKLLKKFFKTIALLFIISITFPIFSNKINSWKRVQNQVRSSSNNSESSFLKKINLRKARNSLEVEILFSRYTKHRRFGLADPNRIVIDFFNVENTQARRYIEVDDFGIKAIRSGMFKPSIVRVVFDIEEKIPSYRIEKIQGGLKVSFTKTPMVSTTTTTTSTTQPTTTTPTTTAPTTTSSTMEAATTTATTASSITTTTVPTTPTTTKADPFYEKLFEEGKYFYQNGNYLKAIENLQIAFFGFPDNLPKLLECYIYLTVCFFKEKNIEKSKYFNSEINRLNLLEYLNEINLPKDLMDKFLEINSYFSRLDLRAEIARSPSSSVKTSSPNPA